MPVVTVLFDYTTADTESGSVTERGAPCLPHPVISMLSLCCQLIIPAQEHLLAGECLAENNTLTQK